MGKPNRDYAAELLEKVLLRTRYKEELRNDVDAFLSNFIKDKIPDFEKLKLENKDLKKHISRYQKAEMRDLQERAEKKLNVEMAKT